MLKRREDFFEKPINVFRRWKMRSISMSMILLREWVYFILHVNSERNKSDMKMTPFKLWIYLFKKVLISQINVYGYEWIAFIIVHFSIRH